MYKADIAAKLDAVIRRVPNFPKPGVLFYDITSILADPESFRLVIDAMDQRYQKDDFDAVAAIEARGFVFAAPFAVHRGLPLILIRKAGKLPGETISQKISLEYGEDELHVHLTDVPENGRVLLVDDLIATGGTLSGAASLIRKAGGEVSDLFGVVGLPFLNYSDKLQDLEITTLVDYLGE
ncbi:adenine phosphoribosyltransferase [Marispirochaeta aestuarii]|uniref:Adenine phosphoribosyltransferase n=1 Tax=Marispirochaeta aestuarii TaxID=1963862 RepID=A0A1Y1S127_9SPIO|nr:adenine phosphoribosyltransferase [Marispirochaeta aestuarii]ORC37208.1 adenine phosphoribosyltransferase [Marispirochaeta aestuarii]